MPKTPQKITTIGPELLREIRQVIAAEQARVAGQLRDDPRGPEKAPDDYVVLTPAGGIPGRVKTRIKGASCAVYKETETAAPGQGGDKLLSAITVGGSPFTLWVYNVYCDAVPGGIYVPTALLKSGTRYVLNWHECESSEPPSDSSESSSDSSESSDSSSSEPSSSEPSSSAPSSEPPSESESECPCSGTCLFSAAMGWNGLLYWSPLEVSTCASPCHCHEPAYGPTFMGEVGLGSCWGPCDSSSPSSSEPPSSEPPSEPPSDSSHPSDSSDSSDSSSPSSSSPSSSEPPSSEASEPILCGGYCTWMANQFLEWYLFHNGCLYADCAFCRVPSTPPTYPYEVTQTACFTTP